MNKKFSFILLSSFFVFFAFIAAYNLSAKNEGDNTTTFSKESPFQESTFSSEQNNDQLLGGPPPEPPDENGTAIDTPINDTIFEILFVLISGVVLLLFRKKLFQLRV